MKVDYEGEASFIQFATGYADFDAIVASQIPFGQQPTGKTTIDYPSETRLGLAWHGQKWGVEADAREDGLEQLRGAADHAARLPCALVGARRELRGLHTYRLGIEYKHSPKISWQFGGLYDPTPVPIESVSPLLPDADRWGVSLGATIALSVKTELQIGYLYLKFKDRSTEGVDPDGYDGTYKTTANLLGFTLVHRF